MSNTKLEQVRAEIEKIINRQQYLTSEDALPEQGNLGDKIIILDETLNETLIWDGNNWKKI